MWRAPELSGVIGAPREGSGLVPRRLGRRLHLERLLGESSGLGLCLCLASQPFQLVRWSRFVRFRANRSKSNEPVDGLQARSREIELLAEFAALLDSLACRVHVRAQLISKLEHQPRSSRDRRTLERLLVRLKIEIELQIEIELEIAVVEGMAHSFVCEDLLHAPCE